MLTDRIRDIGIPLVNPEFIVLRHVHVTADIAVGEEASIEAKSKAPSMVERVSPVKSDGATTILVSMKCTDRQTPTSDYRARQRIALARLLLGCWRCEIDWRPIRGLLPLYGSRQKN